VRLERAFEFGAARSPVWGVPSPLNLPEASWRFNRGSARRHPHRGDPQVTLTGIPGRFLTPAEARVANCMRGAGVEPARPFGHDILRMRRSVRRRPRLFACNGLESTSVRRNPPESVAVVVSWSSGKVDKRPGPHVGAARTPGLTGTEYKARPPAAVRHAPGRQLQCPPSRSFRAV
jgi:hypothetical protein